MSFGGRDVRRVLLIDPYAFLPIPDVEVERHAAGRYTLRTQFRAWTGTVHPVSQAEWDRLAVLEKAAFGPLGENSAQRQANVVVHCWAGLLEASPDRAASWWGCNNGTKAAQEYNGAILTLAMEKAGCADSEKEVISRFNECFADNGRLDDPALQNDLQNLRDRWTKQRERAPDILMVARSALREAKESPTSTTINRAREDVLALGSLRSSLRAILEAGFQQFFQT